MHFAYGTSWHFSKCAVAALRDSTWLCIDLALIGSTPEVNVCQAFATSILEEKKKICIYDY